MAGMKEHKGFVLYKDSGALFQKLTREDAGDLINAIFNYEIEGTIPDNLSAAADMAFTAIKTYLDRDEAAYKEVCAKRAESGRQGGLATQEKARQNQANQAIALNPKANQADKDNGIELETEKENDFKGKEVKGGGKGGGGTLSETMPNNTPAALNWAIFEKTAQEAYKEAHTTYSLNDCLFVFYYYFRSYKQHTGTDHPPLKKETIARIMNEMPYILRLDGKAEEDIQAEDYKTLIDQYFNTQFDNCDYHISHFFSGDIRTNRFYETIF